MSIFKKLAEKVTPPKVKLDLKLEGFTLTLGEELKGLLSVVAEEPVDCDEVRIELACTESNKVRKRRYDPNLKREVEYETWESTSLLNQRLPLSGPLHFEPGSASTFSFAIPIPPTLPPTLKSATRRVEWRVKGVLAVKGRPDATSRAIEVSVAPPGAIRRTVKCPYCGTAYPDDLYACPNCGAPRTQ